eukprot:CAMPEP_0180540106 /NCGR_PEP_ID=MMETSP1036_2-20121128/67245_1 /TAXON_ID=632150 /ORGANISM="Azadinium spinosum, Strain 3D9" /LENGTH=44 /DNA_ID= /DNA_START= /DNA_END= /DNA_ORIENTATION=
MTTSLVSGLSSEARPMGSNRPEAAEGRQWVTRQPKLFGTADKLE